MGFSLKMILNGLTFLFRSDLIDADEYADAVDEVAAATDAYALQPGNDNLLARLAAVNAEVEAIKASGEDGPSDEQISAMRARRAELSEAIQAAVVGEVGE